MDKIDSLILAIQREVRRHDWDKFSVELEPGGRRVVVAGCSICEKQLGTMNEFLDHLADDAIPQLFARLRAKKQDAASNPATL